MGTINLLQCMPRHEVYNTNNLNFIITVSQLYPLRMRNEVHFLGGQMGALLAAKRIYFEKFGIVVSTEVHRRFYRKTNRFFSN